MIRECCVCHRIEQEGEWIKDRFADMKRGVSHVYCPPCFENVIDRIDRHMHQSRSKEVYTVVGADHA